MNPGGPPKTKVTAWEVVEILMGRIDNELERITEEEDRIYYKERLERARTQRLIALESAFRTIDAFAIPSTDPDMCRNYEDLKKYLIKMYSEGAGDKNDYAFK